MKAIIIFTSGFLIPMVASISLLVYSYFSNDWSGNSPLNHIYLIPAFYLICFLIYVVFFAIFRGRAKNLKLIFVAGIVGGLSLMLLPHQMAFIIAPSAEIPAILVLGACMTAALWLSTKAPD
jgi:hypothetical protein